MPNLEALIDLDRGQGGLAYQLAAALREAIRTGRLTAGTRLPSSRDLAMDLRLSRGVVVEAYEQLVAEGRLVSRRGSGTTVAPGHTASPSHPGTIPPIGEAASRPAVGPPAVLPDHGEGGSLRPGVPDLGRFPRDEWRRAYERALRAARNADFGYGEPAGAPRLRTELADYLGRVRAARIEPAGLVVTTGAAQAFGLVAGALRAVGVTAVGMEDPGSVGIRGHLVTHGLRLVAVPVDEDGLDVAALERTGVRAVVVTPAHQFPTGVVLAPARRAALLTWARRTNGLIVEDDYDAEFRYDRDPVGCLQGLAPELVAHLGSVSKALAPAMRLGWLAVPERWRAAVLADKAAADLGGPVLEQLAFAELLASGGYDRHLRRSRLEHRRRRDALVTALRRYLPVARISGVAAGLHLVVELPDDVDDREVERRARANGLAPLALSRLRLAASVTVPGHRRPPAAGPAGLVLGYAADTPDALVEAVRTLASLIPSPRASAPGR